MSNLQPHVYDTMDDEDNVYCLMVSHHMHAPIDLNESKIEDVDYGHENYLHNLWITLFKTIVSTSSTMHIQQNSRMFMNGDINKLNQISTTSTIPCNRV
jgi:hypothetical protein